MDTDPNGPSPVLAVDAVVQACIDDRLSREALTERLTKTLLPWEEMSSLNVRRYCRKNLLGEHVARGQESTRDMVRADESLAEQGFTLLNNDEDEG